VPRGIAQALYAAGARGNQQPHGRPRLILEARRAQQHVELLAAYAIGAGRIAAIDPLVVQALQLALELRLGESQPGIELERRGVNLRRQRPASALELVGDLPVEVDDVGQDECQRQYQRPDDQAPQMNSSAAGARRL